MYFCSCKESLKSSNRKWDKHFVQHALTTVDEEGICFNCGYYAHFGKPALLGRAAVPDIDAHYFEEYTLSMGE